MWCKFCNKTTESSTCEICGNKTDENINSEVYWCSECKTPIIKLVNSIDKKNCPLCGNETKYMAQDIRPVFPEERLLLEILISKPLEYVNRTVWVSNNRYYIDGKVKIVNSNIYKSKSPLAVSKTIQEFSTLNDYSFFNLSIERFVKANKNRLNSLFNEAKLFILETSMKYNHEQIVLSFSGGKDSTVVADLAIRTLKNPSLVHIFGDTTLEFPLTIDYVERYKNENSRAIFKTAKNKEQNFYSICKDIGPPSRVMRWCCSMFKTGPITRVINNMFKDDEILTFYGIRKSESVSRSKYNRVENDSESVKIQKQKVASPIFYWKDIDIWLYILSEKIDFNFAYRLGYDRVGCWCCPNNTERAQYLSKIYMPEQSETWRDFLIDFAVSIGKPDAEIYVDSGKWKARQGGNGVAAAEDVKIKYTECTAEENAKIYSINKPIDDTFYDLFIPLGKIAKGLGRKIVNETIIIDFKTQIPIISIQPFSQDGYDNSVKIKTMNLKDHEQIQRMISYQIRKYNACRQCLKCESLCKFGAISIIGGKYHINDSKCKRCKACITAKYLENGCLMKKYLQTKE